MNDQLFALGFRANVALRTYVRTRLLSDARAVAYYTTIAIIWCLIMVATITVFCANLAITTLEHLSEETNITTAAWLLAADDDALWDDPDFDEIHIPLQAVTDTLAALEALPNRIPDTTLE